LYYNQVESPPTARVRQVPICGLAADRTAQL